MLIYPISFTIDNSETDFELSYQYKLEAQKYKIQDYRVAKCPNSAQDFATCILELIQNAKPLKNEWDLHLNPKQTAAFLGNSALVKKGFPSVVVRNEMTKQSII